MQDCWNQEPQLRPQMSEVLRMVPGFVSKQFPRHGFNRSSSEFRHALERFYGSTEYRDCITHLHGAALEEFVNFLDGVRRNMFTTSATRFWINFSIRCSISRDYLENYLGGHYITSGRYVAIGSHFRGLSSFLVKFLN